MSDNTAIQLNELPTQSDTIKVPLINHRLSEQLQTVASSCTSTNNLLITTAPDNNLESDKGIREGDGIVVDTGKRPSTSGGSYLLRIAGAYCLRSVRKLHDGGLQLATPWHCEQINEDNVDIMGKLIGSLSVRHVV